MSKSDLLEKTKQIVQLYEADVDYLKKNGISISPLLRSLLHKFVAQHNEKFGD